MVSALKDAVANPAGWEHEFESDAVGAVGIKKSLVGEVVAHQSRLSGLVIVKTIDADGQLSKDGLVNIALRPPSRLLRVGTGVIPRGGKVTSVVVTSNHPEARREGLNILAIEEVVASVC